MKRGFLNTPKARRAVQDAYAPEAPPATDPALDQKGSAHEPDREAKATNVNKGVGNGEPVDMPMSGIGGTSMTPAPQSASPTADRKGKEKEKAEEFDPPDALPDSETEIKFPIRPPPGRPGWGYHPQEEELHRVPDGGPQKRAIFCMWPRDPKGKPIMPSDKNRGKFTLDGYPWGATLYDFFLVSRFPDIPGYVSALTSSQVLPAMKEIGELKVKDGIRWTESEPELRDESFAMAGVLLEDYERRVKLGFLNRFSALRDVRKAAMQGEFDLRNQQMEPRSADDDGEMGGGEDQEDAEEDAGADAEEDIEDDEDEEDTEEDEEITEDLPQLDIPVTSPFHPSHYPSPWPLIPFATASPVLQDRIPFHLLPQTLHVHDPFDLLPAVEVSREGASWRSKPDVIRTYNLKLMNSTLKGVKEAREKAEALEEFKARTLVILRYARTQEQKDNFESVIEVPLPPYPKRPTKIEESHLYLSPVAQVGTGNHSVVYKAEWELPRDMFAKPKICASCFQEALEKEKKRLKDTGRWDRMLQAVGWGPEGFAGSELDVNALDEVNDPPILAKDGEIIEREVTCVVPPDATPMEVLEKLEERACWDLFWREKDKKKTFLIQFTEDEAFPNTPPKTYPPPVIRVNPTFSYIDPTQADTVCSHFLAAPVPRTAKFAVVAKLSIQHDPHLGVEAKNYQRFPDHLFQHFNGYTIISKLHTIVPVKAVVPQFYGYYIPERKEKLHKSYLSPILLVEHCGTPIGPDEISVSDKEECASLLLRFQRSGWLHGSVAARNILVQMGSPTVYPLKRMISPELSFRLIDFGRSRKYTSPAEKQAEEDNVIRLFKELGGSIRTTFGVSA